MTTIIRTLRDTSIEARVELDDKQYQHFKLADGQRPDISMPMDINVMREMAALVAHFERPTWQEVAGLAEDEAEVA